MDLRRLRAGEWIAAVSGTVLLVSLFLPWYGAGDDTITAWQALRFLDVVIALAALLALSLPVVTATQRVPAVPIALSAFVTLAGMLATLLVVTRAASLPDGADGREWAVWLALAAALGVIAGGGLSMRDERLSPPGGHTDLTGRPVAGPPDIERLQAPRPR